MASTRSERSERSAGGSAAGALLAGLLAACQATDKPAFVVRAEERLESHRREMNRAVAERTEGLGMMAAALTGCTWSSARRTSWTRSRRTRWAAR